MCGVYQKAFLMRVLAPCLWLASMVAAPAQLTLTNAPTADAFVSSADPTHNFGSAGALSVSGLIATNAAGQQKGALDSLLQFNLASTTAAFDAFFGAGQWSITHVTLAFVEVGAPANSVFNRGVGLLEMGWIANDIWAEGTGTPSSPASSGITWNGLSSLLNSNLDLSLGTFSNGGTNGLLSLSLGLPAAFVTDVAAGGLVSLSMTAPANSTIGFTANSREFGTASARPLLAITAIPEPTTLMLFGLSGAVFGVLGYVRKHSKH